MSIKDIQCVSEGKIYQSEVRTHKKHVKLLDNCLEKMSEPYLYHFIARIDWELFDNTNFGKNFKRTFKRICKREMCKPKEVRQNGETVFIKEWNNEPNYQVIYSLEHKEVEDDKESKLKHPYPHIHFYICVDMCKPFRPYQINRLIIATMNDIVGLSRTKYAKRYSDYNLHYHNLNKDYEDAKVRISYISKINQKNGVPVSRKCNHFKSFLAS